LPSAGWRSLRARADCCRSTQFCWARRSLSIALGAAEIPRFSLIASKPKDVRKLVVEIALANPGWGYTKIRDALRTGLAIEIGRTTVANILAEAGIEPAPERGKTRTWKQFVKAHWDLLCGCDFFSVVIDGCVRGGFLALIISWWWLPFVPAWPA
jgi:putative transposase